MDVPPVKSFGAPAEPGPREAGHGVDLPFAAGQHTFARVVQVINQTQVILDLAGQRLAVSPPVTLTVDQVLHVAVRAVSPSIELDLLEAPAQFSDRAYALAAILHARQEAAGFSRLTASRTQELVAILTARGSSDTSPAAALGRALQPVVVGADAAGLAERLRASVAASGVMFEATLAARLTSSSARLDVHALPDDARVLLSRVVPDPVAEPERERARTLLAGEAVARQLDVALHRVRDNELRVTIPVAMETQLETVELRVRDAEPRQQDDERPTGRTVTFTMDVPTLGLVRTSIQWIPGRVASHFAVDSAQARAALEPELPSLVGRLHAVGFRHASADVAIEPEETSLETDAGATLPGGSIIKVRV